MLNEQQSYDKLMQYALLLVSRKRYTAFEMKNKFIRYFKKYEFTEESIIDKAMDRLTELKYLNDQTFVRDFILENIKLKPSGMMLIKRKLRLKGVDKDVIDEISEGLDTNEDQTAIEALEKKMRRWSELDRQKQRMKASQFLYSRGFKGDTIYRAIQSCYDSTT